MIPSSRCYSLFINSLLDFYVGPTAESRFMSDPDVSFTNNTGEQKIRMSKVKIKVSVCFRTERGAPAWCRISSYLDSMKALGYNPHVAIKIALAGNAADMIKHHDQAA